MEQRHFHENINSGYDKAPYKKHIYSSVDHRGRMHQDSLEEREEMEHDEKVRANMEKKHEHVVVYPFQPQQEATSKIQNLPEVTQRKFDEQDATKVCTNVESKLL